MRTPLLTKVLAAPECLAALDGNEWDLLIRQARSALLLARVGVAVDRAGLWDEVPSGPDRHLRSALNLARHHARAARWELQEILNALAAIPGPVLALKGAAYVAADLPIAAGRFLGDVDILVPRTQIGKAESVLMRRGWVTTHHDAYDQRYYRQWMHELPPMEHVRRGTTLDVHHNILPETARLNPDPANLIADSVAVPGWEPLRILAPTDMVLHSATHLFHDGELEHGLRDLADLDGLLRYYDSPDFWAALVPRAETLELGRPLYYALRYTARLLGTPVPDEIWEQVARCGPSPALKRTMDAMMTRALAPIHVTCADRGTALARSAVYLRGHWLRMPVHRLIPHLLRKAFSTPDLETRKEAG